MPADLSLHSAQVPPTASPTAPAPASRDTSASALRRKALGMVGASYAIDSIMIVGYCALGAGAWWVLPAYVLAACVQCFGFNWAMASGWSRRFRDPSLAMAQMAVGSAVQLGFIALAPSLFAVFAFATFTLVAFGTLQLTIRASLVAWMGLALGIGLIFLFEGDRLAVPTDTLAAKALLVATWVMAVFRCSVIGSFGVLIRDSMYRRQKRAEASAQQLGELAQRDALTGALNRRGITDMLESARSRAQAGGAGFSLAMVDLDLFKQVNDAHGHLTGDAVLKTASGCIASALRSGDVMGRYGGEEFLVILFGLNNAEAALRAAERVRLSIAQQPWGSLVPGLVQTASVGVSVHRTGETVADTIARADAALYQCKHDGRNLVRSA